MTVGGPLITLSNGTKMPQVGLGTWQSSPEEVKGAVKYAINTGYRLIDTAAIYENEEAIGEAIQELIKEKKIKREDLFITTKLWVTHLHPDDTESAIRESLKKLKLDYVDLYIFHMPTCFNHDMTQQNRSVTVTDVWKGLEGVYKKKLTKAIGVSNCSGEQIERIMKVAEVPIHVAQVELHLYWPQHEFQEICKKHKIAITSYATMGSPGRSAFSLKSGAKLEWAPAPKDMDDEKVKKLAAKYKKTPAQILLRYAMDRNIAIIPKSVKIARIKENFDVFDFSLKPDEIKDMETGAHRQRLFWHEFMEGHPEDAFAAERKKDQVKMTVGGPTITLSNGTKMPQVGLGTWQSSPEEVKGAVKYAINTGYRLIDTAAIYENEDAIGEAIQELVKEKKIKREDLFITTKLWVTHLHPDDTEGAIRESLKKLKLDYVNLYIFHMPTCFNHDMTEQNRSVSVTDVWKGLEGVYKKKLTKAIGVSNCSGEQIERIMKVAEVPIHVAQVELHLYWPQHEFQEVCKKHNIAITSYATMGSPGRFAFGLKSGAKMEWAPAPSDMDDAKVKKLAAKYKKTPAQILLRYAMDRNIAIIPKSVKNARIKENFDVFDFSLKPDEIKDMETGAHRQRLFWHEFMEGHPEDAFAAERKKQ
ncbi:unnamed protein product [Cylicocyclus nassatus]|uniref:NADP-dependent oxidoreductase domain-containing protein n=1 Tax=Cylicocyclus nassatus TaxID=53992 RepID=A0AA36M238_CYLNA|nr:unnamed protein product [Cylicocyclus nassatus]